MKSFRPIKEVLTAAVGGVSGLFKFVYVAL